MMSRRLFALCAVSMLAQGVAAGQDNTKKISADSATTPVEVRFTDGGYLRMALAEDYLDLVTQHGKLRIAAAELRRIELATRIPEASQKLIDQAIAGLGSPEFKVREKAASDLLSQRERSYPALLRAAQNKDTETSRRAKDVIDKIKQLVPASRLRVRDRDVVYTSDSTISGRIEVESFSATTKQFGPVKLLLSDAASVFFLNGGAEVELKLDGRYALSNEVWLDTGLEVAENVRVTIAASGEIDMYATGGYVGQYVGTPKGKKAWPGSNGLPHEPGLLLGRIGESGTIFIVRDQFEGPAPATGRLYLRAAGNPYNVRTNGHYIIKIQGGVPAPGGATHAPAPAFEKQ